MYSSSYYNNLMCDYAQKKRKNEEKKKEYERFLEKLEIVGENIPTAKEFLSTSESTFRNGGYNDGDIPGKDKIGTCISNLESASSIIDSVISKTSEKINEFGREITNYTNLYNDAHSNYEAAKKRETLKK